MNGSGSLPQWLTLGGVIVACILLGVNGVQGVEHPAGGRSVDGGRDRTSHEVARLADAVEKLESVLVSRILAPADSVSDAEAAETRSREAGATVPPRSDPGAGPGAAARDPEIARLLATPTRIEAVDAFVERVADVRAVQRALFLSSYREILERFGFPTSVGTEGAGCRFRYDYTGSDGRKRMLHVTFVDGVAVGFYYR